MIYLTADRFMYGFVASLKAQTSLAFKERLRGIDLLILDDVQFIQGKTMQAEFGHTLNALIDGGRQIVAAADRPPADLESLDERVRSRLAGGLVVTRGQERCLYVFPMDEFVRVAEDLRAAPVTIKAVRDYMRVLLSGASDEIPDKQGRVTIPQALRDYAGLDRDVVVVGVDTRFEIWDATAWDAYVAEQEAAYAESESEGMPTLS